MFPRFIFSLYCGEIFSLSYPLWYFCPFLDFCDQKILSGVKWIWFFLILHSWTCRFHFHYVVFPWKMKILWYLNISQDCRDYIKTFDGNQIWQEGWPDCIVSSQQWLWECQVSELPCHSSQTVQAVLILSTFPLWDWMLQVSVFQVSCPSTIMCYITYNPIVPWIICTVFKNKNTVFIISQSSETVAVQCWCWMNYEVTLPM